MGPGRMGFAVAGIAALHVNIQSQLDSCGDEFKTRRARQDSILPVRFSSKFQDFHHYG